MAVKIPNLKRIADELTSRDYLYKDLHLDFAKDYNYDKTSHTKTDTNDIQVDYDFKAVVNSIYNLFNTKPGQRFLFPEYGLDLYQFLFEPVTRVNAQSIGERIVHSVKLYEPRVRVVNCHVVPVPDDNEYQIDLTLDFPVFNTRYSLDAKLNTTAQTFIIANTSRTK